MAYTPLTPGGVAAGIQSFSGVGGNFNNQTVVSNYDMYTPAQMVTLYRRHGQSVSFRALTKLWGLAKGANTPTVGHYEQDWENEPLQIGSVVTAASGAGADHIVALAASAMFNTAVTVGGAARQASSIKVGDIVVSKLNKMRARVIAKNTTVNPHRITLKPLRSTDDIALEFVAGDYAVVTAAWGEGGGMPEGHTPKFIKYTNTFQIVKEKVGVTGSEATNQMYFKVQRQEGSIWLQTTAQAQVLFENKMDGALIFGQQINNLVDTSNTANLGFDVPIQGTEGFLEFAESSGHTDTYTTGSYALSDFDSMSAIFKGERVTPGNMVLCLQGYGIYNEIENLLFSEFDQVYEASLSQQLFPDTTQVDGDVVHRDTDFAVNIGFRAIKKAGFVYNFKELTCLSDPRGTGLPGYDYTNYQLASPLGYMTDYNPNNGGEVDKNFQLGRSGIIGYQYKKLGNFSREVQIGQWAGVGSAMGNIVASGPNDTMELGMLSEIAFHGACANKVVIQKPA